MMTVPASEPTVPAWYPDPLSPAVNHRWWDGIQWTDHILPQPSPPVVAAAINQADVAMTPSAQNFPEDHTEFLGREEFFDASTPPAPGDLVPADCAWTQRPHPGPLPKRPLFGDTKSRIGALGTIAGRTEREIVEFIGPPDSRSSMVDGYILQWFDASGFSSYHLVLNFDPYGVCWGISHETM